ncbi:hypothetical protein N9933_01020 [bacterium]|nr:hypothetical protein [bacterium]
MNKKTKETQQKIREEQEQFVKDGKKRVLTEEDVKRKGDLKKFLDVL